MAMIAAIAFLTYAYNLKAQLIFRPTASAMFSPAIPKVMEEFQTSSAVLGSFSVSMFILGYAIGPLSDPFWRNRLMIDSLRRCRNCTAVLLSFMLAILYSQSSRLAARKQILWQRLLFFDYSRESEVAPFSALAAVLSPTHFQRRRWVPPLLHSVWGLFSVLLSDL